MSALLQLAVSRCVAAAAVLLAGLAAAGWAPASAGAVPGRWEGSFSFERSFDQTRTAGGATDRLTKAEQWTVTLPDEATLQEHSNAETYEATVTGTASFASEAHCDATCTDPDRHYFARGTWGGSGRVSVSISPQFGPAPDYAITGATLSIIRRPGDGLTGSQSGDAVSPPQSSEPMVIELLATIGKDELRSRTASVCLECGINRVTYIGRHPATETVPLDTSKLKVRERADLVTSVTAPEEAAEEDDGVVTTVATVSNRGPDPARQVKLDDSLTGDGELVSAASSRGACTTTGRSATCALGDMPVGASAQITLRTRVGKLTAPGESDGPPGAGASSTRNAPPAHAGPHARFSAVSPGRRAESTRSATASSSTPDPNGANNSAQRTTKTKCVPTLRAGPITLRAGCWRRASKTLWTTSGTATYNGLTVKAPGRLAVNVKALTFAASGTATVSAGTLLLYRGELKLKLKGKLAFRAEAGAKLKGLPVSGSISGTAAPGRLKFKATISLPSTLGGVSGRTDFTTVDGSGLRLDLIKVDVARVSLGRVMRVEKIELTYRRSSKEWSSKATVHLPGPKSPTVTASLKLRGGSFHSLTADVNGINRPIATGVFLQSVGFGVVVSPFTLDGRMTLTGGPRVFGAAAVTSKGKMRYRDGTYTISGELELVKAKLAKAMLRFTTPSAITLQGSVDQSLGSFGFGAKVTGWLDGRRAFQVDGSGKIKAPGPDVNGVGLISNRGMGACGNGFDGIQVGFRYRWGDKLPRPGCDLGPIATARAAQAASGQIDLPAGLRQALITVEGSAGPPMVRVSGPGGLAIDVTVAGPDAAQVEGRFLAYRLEEDGNTYVFIGTPPAGRYTVTPLAGSPPVAAVSAEAGLPAPKVSGRVRVARRNRARLAWRLRPIAGQRVTFVEQSTDVRRVLLTTNRARGRLRFKPAPGSRARNVVAYVEQDGVPRTTRNITRFRLKGRR